MLALKLTQPRIGNQGEPVAERTKLGWVILSPEEEIDTTHMFLTQTSQVDYEELCKLDVLGLADTPQHDQGEVYREFCDSYRAVKRDGMKQPCHGKATTHLYL